ncbi:carbohydrate ABC transporter permease [Clostridium sp.]|uniref:carbohydrate ABC transporter permease n=1 Tax=Clostridium sp. TaxID=1506 RepID=UPI003FD78579
MFGKLSYKKQEKVVVFLFLFIPLLFLTVFTFLPAINMIYYSFIEWNGYSVNKTWVGFANYIEIFRNPTYFLALKNSIYYFFGGFVQLFIAFYFAVIINGKLKGKSIYKAILFFPYLLNGVAISLIFVFFLRPNGTLDSMLKIIGMGQYIHQWLGSERIINFSLASVSIWRYVGFNFIIFLGAIQSISGEVMEAADLDGATEWQKVKYIILPSVKKIIELNLILAVSGAISVFEIPYIMTGGANGSNTFVIQTVNTAFKFQRVGLGSAMAVIVLIIVAVATITEKVFFKEAD